MHDVDRFIAGLSEKLASRSRHVSVFLGAGSSRACGLPDVSGLETHLRENLTGDSLARFDGLSAGRNLEQVLSRVRRIAVLLQGASDVVDGLSSQQARELDMEICQLIITRLGAEPTTREPALRLAGWAGRAEYHAPVEIFTVNYDLLVEAALEALGVPYFDGFVGNSHGRFRHDLVEADPGSAYGLPSFFVRVWKLHGSVNWAVESEAAPTVVRLGTAVPDDKPVAIYPSDAKYDESRRVPFLVLQDRFRRALEAPETLALIAGYAFGDEHLNELIYDAARRRPRSEFVVFCYSTIPEQLASVAANTPNLQVVAPTEAIIGGRRMAWGEPESAPDEVWSDGAVRLGDFDALSTFLARTGPTLIQVGDGLAQPEKDEASA